MQWVMPRSRVASRRRACTPPSRSHGLRTARARGRTRGALRWDARGSGRVSRRRRRRASRRRRAALHASARPPVQIGIGRFGAGQIWIAGIWSCLPWYEMNSPVVTPRMISIIASMRASRVVHSVPLPAKSSGHGERPTPNRSFVMTATDAACFATSTGWRIGSFTTKVVKRSRSFTAPSAAIRTNGSMNGRPPRKWRFPSGCTGTCCPSRAGSRCCRGA